MAILGIITYIFLLHWLADYICQPYWMKVQKVKSLPILCLHVAIYCGIMFLGLLPLAGFTGVITYIGVNAILHLGVDLVTSRIISSNTTKIKILNKDEKKPFYERINIYGPIAFLGFDQLLHQACLILTISFLGL